MFIKYFDWIKKSKKKQREEVERIKLEREMLAAGIGPTEYLKRIEYISNRYQ